GVAPGTNTTPDTNTTLPSDTNGTNSGTNTTPESGDNNVRLEAPGASISSRYQNRVTTAIGPGMTGGPGVSSGGENPSAQSGSAPMSGSSSYVDIIMNAGIQSGVNPYVLAAMILQEQGKGTSPLISGTYSGYEGYYNFFNIEAYQSGSMDAIQNGLRYASQSGSYGRPWNSVEKSILGGSLVYGDTYVKSGQDTFYLKKFNVQGSNLYKHQYMTNVQGAASEGALYAKAYSEELKKSVLEFRIPVYQNMPDAISVKPTLDGSPNNKLAGLGVNGFALTPTFHRDKASYDLIVDTSVAQVTINAAAIDSAAVVSGAGNINLQSGNNDIKISVKAQNGSVRDYVIHVVRQQNGPTHDGSVNTGMTGGSSGNTNSGTQSGPGGPGVGLNSGGSPSGGTTTGGSTTGNTETYGPGGSNITIVQ
ncbi:MAG: cadherin-like beta sandwich domain-containing protein, partial [Hungatella sp.]